MTLVLPNPHAVRRQARALASRGVAAVLLGFTLATATQVGAQVNYDPYSPSSQPQAPNPFNPGGFGNGGGSSSQTAAPFNNPAGPNYGNSAPSGATDSRESGLLGTTEVGGADDLGGTGSQGANGQNARDTQVVRPTDGSSPGALYARPGAVPGQFELYRRPPPEPSEFETFVNQTVGKWLPRFGSSLVLNRSRGFIVPSTTAVPPSYLLNPGDELLISVTGSLESKLRLVIDNEGRIFVPRVGVINLAGVRYGDLADALSRRFSEQFKQARVSVVISHLHGLTVYVTGYAVSPGAYTVSSLSTMVDAVLAAGGPSAGGSFRSVELRRGGKLVSTLDLYDLLLNGDKSRDAVLQNNDVLNVEPVGPEVAIDGSVNLPAIFEAKPGETLGDIIRYAGGLNSLADDSRVIVARLGDLDTGGSRQLAFNEARRFPAERGSVMRILSLGKVARPQERQAVLATIEGEVNSPGRYFLPPGATVADLLAKAGGLTPGAFVFGAEVDRESVRTQQQASFDKAIDNLELAAITAPITGLVSGSPSSAARGAAAGAVIEKLKQRKPDGRVVLSLAPEAVALPGNLGLENNDRIFVPPRPKIVGVFGAVYQTGSFLYASGTRLGDYLRLAGGPQRTADRGDIFVVRANGAVLSSHQDHGFAGRYALPGDVIFVPVRTSPSAFERLLQIAGVVSQFGVSALTFKALGA